MNLALGPSWLPKVGALLGVVGAAMEVLPFDAPGAAYVKPYQHFLIAIGTATVGFTARQNNVSSEEAGAKPPAESTKPTP